MQNIKENTLKNILEDLWSMEITDCAYDGYEGFEELKTQLLQLLTPNIQETLSLINSLDFNEFSQAYILTFLQDIISGFKSSKDRFTFVKYIESLKDKYPDVNFDKFLFYVKCNL